MNLKISHKNLDKNSFERLFNDYFNPLCNYAYGFLNDRDTTQEIVQDVFINLWNKKDSIDPGKSVKSYLYTSVKNRCLNFIRDHKKFRSQYLDIELELEIPFHEYDQFSESETQDRINAALDKLPEKCRQVFELSRFEELKYKEIAAKMDISVKTVEVQMSKALKILREDLKDLIFLILILIILK